jgi:hypothetical protein
MLTQMRLPQWRPRSLRRLATAQKAQLEGASRRTRLYRRIGHVLWLLVHDRYWALLIGVPAFGIAFLPISWSLAPLKDATKAHDYLGVLWQVEAAGLALSLAVVIFIFEAVYSAPQRPSLRDLAARIRLPAIFYAGLYGLGVTGMVLLGGGTRATGGWSATWAVFWAVLSTAGLISLFAAVLSEIEPNALYRRWLEALRAQVANVVETEVLQRLATARLQDLCSDVGISFAPFFAYGVAPHLGEVRALRSGVISDVNLWQIAKGGRLSTETEVALAHHGEKPVVLVTIGSRVREGDVVMRLARVIHQYSNFSKAFKIVDTNSEAELHATLRQMHDAASRVIRERSPGAYSDVNEVYEHVLLAFPETWARYRQQFVGELAAGMHVFDWTLLDRVEDNLRDELEAAVEGGSREIAREALNLPIQVAMRATTLRATALSGRMLRLFSFGLYVLVRVPHDEYRRSLINWSLLRLSEHARHIEYEHFRGRP